LNNNSIVFLSPRMHRVPGKRFTLPNHLLLPDMYFDSMMKHG
jgi:hypothetical protein